MLKKIFHRPSAQRAFLPALVGLLVLTFVLTAVLAYQAQDADRRHREAAEAALRDYTELAADQWQMRLETNLIDMLRSRLTWMRSAGLKPSSQPSQQLLAMMSDSALCKCIDAIDIESLALLSLGGSAGDLMLGDLEKSEIRALRDTVQKHPSARAAAEWNVGWLPAPNGFYGYFATTEAPGIALVYKLSRRGFASVLDSTFRDEPLLAGGVNQDVGNDELFAVTVHDGSGRTLMSNVSEDRPLASTQRLLSLPAGGLQISVELRPTADVFLIPGGMPHQRSPWLVLLLGVIGLVLSSAFILMRRETELIKLRTDFVSSVGHELRTPLAQIRMFTETLLLGRVRGELERRRSLEIIDQEARRLSQLVENIMAFSKGARRQTRIAPEPIQFVAELQKALDSYAPLTAATRAEIRLEVQENIVVPVDTGALRQIVINLLENALKYGPAAQRVTIGAAIFDDCARLWVDDEGPGIPVADRTRIFDSFHRLNREIERQVTGSGIGLSVVRELVTLHDGRVWVDDAPGGGARIVAEFPGAYVRATESARDQAVA